MLNNDLTFGNTPSIPVQPDSTKCTKANIEHIEIRPETWKFVDQKILDANIEDFCRNIFEANARPAGYRQEASYQDLPIDQTDVHTWDLNYVKLRVEWGTSTTISNKDCVNKFKALSADCDWSPEPYESNPNWFKYVPVHITAHRSYSGSSY
jgi:hypothetical protein